MTLGNLFILSKPRFYHVENGDKTGLQGGCENSVSNPPGLEILLGFTKHHFSPHSFLVKVPIAGWGAKRDCWWQGRTLGSGPTEASLLEKGSACHSSFLHAQGFYSRWLTCSTCFQDSQRTHKTESVQFYNFIWKQFITQTSQLHKLQSIRRKGNLGLTPGVGRPQLFSGVEAHMR